MSGNENKLENGKLSNASTCSALNFAPRAELVRRIFEVIDTYYDRAVAEEVGSLVVKYESNVQERGRK